MFYIGSIFVAGTLIPFTEPNLLHGEESIAFSPFTIVFQRIPKFGFYAANVMNFVILSSVLSCGNSSLYVSSRMLYAMSLSGKAPGWFGKVNRHQVPVAAVWATGLVGALAFLSNAVGGQKIYQVLYNFSSLTGFLIWLGIALCHLRFRKAWVAQGRRTEELKFRSRFYPFGPWIAVALFLIVLFGANIDIFLQPDVSRIAIQGDFFSRSDRTFAFLADAPSAAAFTRIFGDPIYIADADLAAHLTYNATTGIADPFG